MVYQLLDFRYSISYECFSLKLTFVQLFSRFFGHTQMIPDVNEVHEIASFNSQNVTAVETREAHPEVWELAL